MIAFRALGWRQTATLWWRTRETTAWRSTSISSRPSSAPVDGHLLVYQAFELVLGPLRSRCSWSPQWTATILASQSTVEIGVAPPCPPAPFQSLSRIDSYEDNLRERARDLQTFQVEAPWAPTLLVKTYLSRSVLCQIDEHHNINHVFNQLFVVLFGQHAKITNYNHVLSLAYWICMTDNGQIM